MLTEVVTRVTPWQSTCALCSCFTIFPPASLTARRVTILLRGTHLLLPPIEVEPEAASKAPFLSNRRNYALAQRAQRSGGEQGAGEEADSWLLCTSCGGRDESVKGCSVRTLGSEEGLSRGMPDDGLWWAGRGGVVDWEMKNSQGEARRRTLKCECLRAGLLPGVSLQARVRASSCMRPLRESEDAQAQREAGSHGRSGREWLAANGHSRGAQTSLA